MKRQWIAIGLAALGLVLFAFIVSTIAAPHPQEGRTEKEPNSSFGQANPMVVPGSISGVLSTTVDTKDYFSCTTTAGQVYNASLDIGPNPNLLRLKVLVFNRQQAVVHDNYYSAGSFSFQFTALDSFHYILVQAESISTTTILAAHYDLGVYPRAGSPEPMVTPIGPDPYESHESHESNDTREAAYALPIATSATAPGATFHHKNDVDWYKFYVKSGRYYQALTGNLVGVDTRIDIHTRDGAFVKANNDGGGGFASLVEWRASYDGWYYVQVTNVIKTDPYTSGSYDLTVREVAAPPTTTPTPAPVSPGQIDRCEDNSTLDQACTIAANGAETFNFVAPHSGPDNDHYRIWIKPGMLFNCRTSNLAPGVDPNMILYDLNRNGIGGNDDVAPGDYNSAFSHYATYSGWLYVLVGYGNRTPSDIANSNYTLNCTTSQPGDPTATSQSPSQSTPTSTPGAAATLTPVPVATPEPAPQLSVRVLATPAPGAAVTPAPRFVPITLLVYYDANDDWQPGAGEGIAGVSAQAYAAATNQLLAQGFTDDRGHLDFTVAAQGPVRVSIPYLGFSQLVATHGGSICIRVAPALAVGGAP